MSDESFSEFAFTYPILAFNTFFLKIDIYCGRNLGFI
jgi:hypothetical protein